MCESSPRSQIHWVHEDLALQSLASLRFGGVPSARAVAVIESDVEALYSVAFTRRGRLYVRASGTESSPRSQLYLEEARGPGEPAATAADTGIDRLVTT